MALPARMKFGVFMAPFHWLGENSTLALERDMETLQWLDYLGFDEAWIGEHHSAGWETIVSPEVFIAAGRYPREYFEQTLGQDSVTEGPVDKNIDAMVEKGAWCVGTPDDLIARIEQLDEDSGGFGGFLIQATEWGTREQVMHSYELLARYVMPRFQGSLANLEASQAWSAAKKDELNALRIKAYDRASQDYAARR